MWNLWLKAKNFSQLPSSVFGEDNALAAWMLDNAVQWFGLTIENALAERVEVQMGREKRSKPKYTLARLLQDGFKLPQPVETEENTANPWFSLMQWVGKPGNLVRRYTYVPPKREEDDGSK